MLLTDEGKHADALASFKNVLSAQPDNAKATYYVGYLDMLDGRLNQAREQLNAAVRLAPRDPQPYYALALTLRRLNQQQESREAFRKFRELQGLEKQQSAASQYQAPARSSEPSTSIP